MEEGDLKKRAIISTKNAKNFTQFNMYLILKEIYKSDLMENCFTVSEFWSDKKLTELDLERAISS